MSERGESNKTMKILFLAPANNYHTQKWCGYFVSRGYEVHVISFFPGSISGVTVHYLDCGVDWQQPDSKKLKYLLKTPRIRRIVSEIDPDIISVHYATSYGTAAGIAGLKNYALSVWGGDIYTFPHKSPIHRALLQYSLEHAACLLSTSAAMAREVGKYTDKKFYVTPFGVKTELFSPERRNRAENDGSFVIGTVKALKPKYGIDVLLRAVALIREHHPEIPIRLRIAGDGPCEEEYHRLAEELKIGDITDWLGFISQEDFAKYQIGHTLTFSLKYDASATYHQYQFDNWEWASLPGQQKTDITGDTDVAIEITQDLKDAVAAKGLRIHGHGFSVVRVTYK